VKAQVISFYKQSSYAATHKAQKSYLLEWKFNRSRHYIVPVLLCR